MMARSDMARYLKDGMTKDQAFDRLVEKLRISPPGMSERAATQEANARLAQSNNIVAQQQRDQPRATAGPSRPRQRRDQDSSSSEEEDSDDESD
jgi:hypothetical protein